MVQLGLVIHQYDLVEELGRRPVDDAVDGPEEGGPALVVEDEDDAGGGEVGGIVPVATLLLSCVRHSPVQRDLVTHQLVEPVHSFQPLLLRLLLHPELVSLTVISWLGASPVTLWLIVARVAG